MARTTAVRGLTILGTILLALVPMRWSSDPAAHGQDKAEQERLKARDEAWDASAKLIDRLFLDGKVAKVTQTVSDPATYREYAELAYSMNPVDLYYYATPDYKKELLFSAMMTVFNKTVNIAGPVVGFELTIGLEGLDHMIRLEKGKEPFKLTPDLRAKFIDAFKTLIHAEGKWGKAFDFVFVDRTANDAIKEIHKLSQAFREAGRELDGFATGLRREEETKKLALEKQVGGSREEIKRLQGLVTPDTTAERKQELAEQIGRQQQSLAIFERQVQLSVTRLNLAQRMIGQAEAQRDTATRLDRIADGVKNNLPLLGKLAAYLQKNKEGIPVTDVDDMIDMLQEVAKRERDWKGELEDLYELYHTRGLSGLLEKAMDTVLASRSSAPAKDGEEEEQAGDEDYQDLVERLGSLRNLRTMLDSARDRLEPLNEIVEAGQQMQGTYLQVVYWGDNNIEKLRKAAETGIRVATGQGTTEDYRGVRDAARKANELLDRREKIEKKLASLRSQLESLQKFGVVPSWEEMIGKENLKEIQGLIDGLEEEKKEILKYLEEHSDVMKAWKWVEKQQKSLKEMKEKWKTVLEVMTDVVKLLDKDMPTMDLAPDQEYKDVILGWYGGKGTTYTGFVAAGDGGSGINPESVHLFWYDVQTKTNQEIKDIKVIPEKKVEFQLLATRISEARIRYRFQPPDTGDYIVWGYLRDRAGHATCALANSRLSVQEDHAKWEYQPEKPEERQVLEFVKKMMEEVGCNPDEVFRKRDFHEVRLKLKVDDTPARVVIHEPYNTTDNGLDGSRLRFHFDVEDPESWFNTDDVAVWITDEYGRLVWDPTVFPDLPAPRIGQKDEPLKPDRSSWKIKKDIKPEEKFRAEKTGLVPQATFDIPGARVEGPGIYYACVQVMNGAQVVSGNRQMFFVGEAKPWTLITDISPFKAVYQQGDELRLTHTFWNIKDVSIRKVTLKLQKAPAILSVVSAEEGSSLRAIPTGAREKVAAQHVFKVASKPEQSQQVTIAYEATIEYESASAPRKVQLEVPINLYNEDATKVSYVKGLLTYQHQKDVRPVPFGTSLCISQVYLMPALGTPKWVEQYVGYGEIGNDAGEFFMKINPVGKPPYRMRMVAKSYATEKDKLKGGNVGIAGVFGLETSRPLICITPTFDVSVAAENVFKNNVYDVGTQTIPYYSGFMKDKSRRIPIPWEGELSTGGYISPYGHDFAQNPFRAYGSFLTSVNPTDISRSLAAHGEQAPVENVVPGVNAMESGIWYLNFNGSLSILGTLVKGHRFSKQIQYLAPDGSPYQGAFLPLAFEKGKPLAGKPPEIVATKQGAKIDISTRMQKALENNFPFRADVIQEKHIKEDFYEEHEFVYQSNQAPPIKDYLTRAKKIEKVQYKVKKIPVRFFVIADTKKNRVVELEPTTNVVSTAIANVAEPVSVEKLSKTSYLVCVRGENKVAIYRDGAAIWTCPREKDAKPDTILKGPEFATFTEAGTVLICDAGNQRVLEIDPQTDRVLWTQGKLGHPVMAQLTSAGTFLITDRDKHQVLELDSTGKVVWSFGSAGKAGAGNLLNRPQSALRAGKTTIIADAGNQRVLHIGAGGKIQRSIGPIEELKTDPQTGKSQVVSITLNQLAFAARYSGVDYLINGDVLHSVAPERPGEGDKSTGRWGGTDHLGLPEHFTVTSLKVPVKTAEKVYEEEPFYVWKQTVKVVKKAKTRIYLDDPKGTPVKLDPRFRENVPGTGATANYAPGHLLAREHGLATTGLALNQERLRIYVNGGKENADDNDPHVIARAYGAMLRNKLIRRSLEAFDYDQRVRTRPRLAWERGWDTFIACAILEDPRFVDRTFLSQEIPSHTFDLEKTYQDMLARYKKEPQTLDRDFHVYRGLDSPFALAMLLQQIYRNQGSVVVSHAVTFARGGGSVPSGRYIDPATLLALYPDMRETFEVLGLIPRLVLQFPNKGVQTQNNAYPKLEWDANGILEDVDSVDFTLVISEGKPDNVIRRIAGIRGQVMDFGKILDPEDIARKLAEQFEGRKVYYWRVEITLDDGPLQYQCSTPWGAFEIEVKSQVIQETGGTVSLEAANSPLRQFGKLIVPPGTFKEPVSFAVHPVTLARDLGDFEAIHGRAFDLRLSTPARFQKPATIEFQFTDKDLAGRDPRGLGIYRLDPAAATWEFVGAKLGQGAISADIDHNSVYALLYDRLGPAFVNVADSPDPATQKDTLTIRFGLRKPTLTSLTITDAAGKGVRTLIDNQLLSGVRQEVQLPLRELPEGRYFYVLAGSEPTGGQEPPVKTTRTFVVSNAPRGSVQGKVSTPTNLPPVPLRVFIPDTSLEFRGSGQENVFVLEGVAPGKHAVRFERPGTFPETKVVEVRAGETIDLGEVSLTDRVLSQARVQDELFTPNGDGDRDLAVLELHAERPCRVKVRALDRAGKQVAVLYSGKGPAQSRERLNPTHGLTAGRNVLLWRGSDDRGRPLASGWYTLEVTADALGVWVAGAKVAVLLDRGLVRECLPLPGIFSPNGDGLDDELQITYLLDAEATVTVEVRDAQGRILAMPARDVRQTPGANAITWDGKLADGKTVPDGKYSYQVIPRYVTGQPSLKVSGEFLIDSVPPEIVEFTPLNGQKIADGRPTLTARVRADAGDIDTLGLRFKINENTVVPDSFDAKTGVFTFRPRTALGEGTHIAIAYARDLAGNEAPPRAVSFTIDRSTKEKKYLEREPPTIAFTSIGTKLAATGPKDADKTIVYTGTPLIAATLHDAGSGIDDRNIVVYFNGERICNNVKFFLPGASGKSWDWYYYEKAVILFDPLLGEMRYVPGAALAPGKHHVRLEVMDRHGNQAKAESIFTVVLDNEPPRIADFTPAHGSVQTGSVSEISAKIMDDGPSGLDLSTLRLLVNGREMTGDFATKYNPKSGLFIYRLPQPLAQDSQHVILLTVRDRAGNATQAKANLVTLVKDTTPPRIDVYSPRPNQELPAQNIRLLASVYDLGLSGLDEKSLRLHIDGRPEKGFVLQGGILEFTLPPQTPGPHVITLFARDRADNGAQEAIIPFTVSRREESR